MRNKCTCQIIKIGDVHLEIDIGYKLIIKDVRHVPDLCVSLISTGDLDEEGYNNIFGKC